jgi:hypothetical protein
MDGGSESVPAPEKKWSKASRVRESVGRPPKRVKNARWRSPQQQAFAAGVLHSVCIYKGLQPHQQEIRTMLHERGLIDRHTMEARDTCEGARPDAVADARDAQAAEAWLAANHYAAGTDRPHRAKTVEGHLRVRLTKDAVAGHDSSGAPVFVSLEQLCAWVYLWADRGFELQWLGMEVGFGVFFTSARPQACLSRLQGVADYEVQDPHAMIQVSATLSDRQNGDRTRDFVSIYGPLTLVNSAYAAHSSVVFKDKDLGQGSKTVHLAWRQGRRHKAGPRQVFANYPAPNSQHWCCMALGPPKTCRTPLFD